LHAPRRSLEEMLMRQRALLALRGGELLFSRLAEREVLTIMALLAEYEIASSIATECMRPLRFRSVSLRPDVRFEDVSEKEYAGVIIPSAGMDGDRIYERDPPSLIELLKRFNARKKTIAAQGGGVLALARAGILDGVKFAIEERYAALAPLGFFQGTGVAMDGNIITSGRMPTEYRSGELSNDTALMVKHFAFHLIGRHCAGY